MSQVSALRNTVDMKYGVVYITFRKAKPQLSVWHFSIQYLYSGLLIIQLLSIEHY